MKKKLCAITLLFTLLLSTLVLSSCGVGFANMLNEEMRASYVHNKAMKNMYKKACITTEITQTYISVFDGETNESKIKYRVIDDYSEKSKYKCMFELIESGDDSPANYQYCYDGKTLYEKSGELLLKQDMTEDEFYTFTSASTSNTLEQIDFYRDLTMTCGKSENGIFTVKIVPANDKVLKNIYAGMKNTIGSSYPYMSLESYEGEYVITEDFNMVSSNMTYVIKSADDSDTSYTFKSSVTYSYETNVVNPPENMGEYKQTDGLIALAEAEAATNQFVSQDSGKCKMNYKSKLSQGSNFFTLLTITGDIIYYTDDDENFIFEYNADTTYNENTTNSKITYDGNKLHIKNDASSSEQEISEIEAAQYVTSILAGDVYIDKSEYKTITLSKSNDDKNVVLCASLNEDYVTNMVSAVLEMDDFKVVSIPESTKTFELDENGNLIKYQMKILFNFKYQSETYKLSIEYVMTNEGLGESNSDGAEV